MILPTLHLHPSPAGLAPTNPKASADLPPVGACPASDQPSTPLHRQQGWLPQIPKPQQICSPCRSLPCKRSAFDVAPSPAGLAPTNPKASAGLFPCRSLPCKRSAPDCPSHRRKIGWVRITPIPRSVAAPTSPKAGSRREARNLHTATTLIHSTCGEPVPSIQCFYPRVWLFHIALELFS